jgi:hypothetical protein
MFWQTAGLEALPAEMVQTVRAREGGAVFEGGLLSELKRTVGWPVEGYRVLADAVLPHGAQVAGLSTGREYPVRVAASLPDIFRRAEHAMVLPHEDYWKEFKRWNEAAGALVGSWLHGAGRGGCAFVHCGSSHILGENGIAALLRRKGHTVAVIVPFREEWELVLAAKSGATAQLRAAWVEVVPDVFRAPIVDRSALCSEEESWMSAKAGSAVR